MLPEATSDGVALIGKNADLPSYSLEVGVVIECKPKDMPAYLTVTLAGLVSYEGINEYGMGVTANFLEVHVNPYVLELTGKPTPKTGLEGKFSIYHSGAIGFFTRRSR